MSAIKMHQVERGDKKGSRELLDKPCVDNVTHRVMSGDLTWKEYELYCIRV